MDGKILGTIVRFVVSALVLMLIVWLLPGITVRGFTGALIGVVIAILGYIVEAVLGKKVSPQGRGIVGFITADSSYLCSSIYSSVIFKCQYSRGFACTLVIGVIDAFVPTELR